MPSLLKKKADVVLSELKKAENVENARKEHVLATYDFNCKLGRRILRFEGTNEFGVDIYYDYNTKKTGSLDVLAKYLGASNLRTDKIDLEKGQAVAPEAAPQKEPEVQAPLRTPTRPIARWSTPP